jgi:hypothetical protein
MNEIEFCYWLRGFFEITGDNVIPTLSPNQIAIIKEHLDLVFNKVTKTKSSQIPYCDCNKTQPPDNLDSKMDELLNTKHTGIINRPVC